MPLKDQSEEKTILFLCKCSTHVSNYIEFETIIDWAKAQKSINVVAISNLLCAPRGKEFYKEILSDFSGGKIKSIVVAACSPKLHEKTFRTMAEELDINISKVNMANIREQCAWVTKDKGLATQKAIRLINAALKRSFLTEDLIQKKMQVESDICVIGGGVAGMMAARVLSQAGRKVFLIEKNISIGGAVIKSEEVAPNMACSPCLLAPILSDIRDDPNIQVIANAELTEVLGFFGNFTVRAKRKARFIKDNCIGCEECFPVCPVEL
jgi:heterodisulfide reductase subunit A